MPTQRIIPVRCSTCGTQFNAPVENIVDGQDPAMKSAFLQGQLNLVQCPQCGAANTPAVPVLYYDLEKEFAFVWVPTELTLTGQPQEKIIGDLSNSLINSLPAEQRKFYLFNPKVFLSLESMIKAVLETEGITEEMLEAQAARARLLEELLRVPDERALKEKIKERDAELDYDFFEMLTFLMQRAYMSGDQTGAQTLLGLRTFLRRWSSQGKKAISEIDQKLGVVVVQNQEELLERLQQAKDEEEFASLISAGHPLLDYSFFQKLTNKIDKIAKEGDQQTAAQLRHLRSRILATKAKQEEESQAALNKATELLREILQSKQPEQVIDEKLDQIDEAFMYILRANIEEARRQGQEQPAQVLQTIGNIILSKLQQAMGDEAEPETEAEEQATEKPTIHIATR